MAVGSAKDVLIFTGIMDGDTQQRFIRDGNYITLINGRTTITNNGQNGAVEDTEGNILVLNQYLALGENKVVGSYEDLKDKSIIYFVYNSLGYHGIFRWYQESPGNPLGEIQRIFQVIDPSIYNQYNKNPLNFDKDFLITGIELTDNLLNWNCYNDEPKQMDIVKANNTNKKKVYDLFFNEKSIGQTVDFIIQLYSPLGGLPTEITITDTSNSNKDRVTTITNAINQTPGLGFIAVDKVNYIELHVLSEGDYRIVLLDYSSQPSRLLPNNFYPDYRVPGNFFYRIQMPPTCSPEAYYVPTNSVTQNGVFSADYNGFTFGWQNNKKCYYHFIGIIGDNNDVDNNAILGPNKYDLEYLDEYGDPINQILVYNYSTGHITYSNAYAQAVPFVIRFDYEISFADDSNSGWPLGGLDSGTTSYGIAAVQFWLVCVDSNNNIVNQVILGGWKNSISPAPPYTNTIINTGYLSYEPNKKWYLHARSFRTSFEIRNAVIRVGTNELLSERDIVDKQTACFRAKYIYENYQNSVYGQSTGVILRTENYEYQKQIYVDFRDKIIENDFYATRLKNVVISTTLDNGATWYDVAKLNKYQFICQNTSFYVYNGNETLVAVSPEEAETQFHAVPIRAHSLTYADNRLIDGGIIEGYDNIDVSYELEPYIYDVLGASLQHYDFVQNVQSNPNVSPSNQYLDYPISVEGFRFGFYGKIGIVYYDDYDRKTGVLLSENPVLRTPNYSDLLIGENYGNAIEYLYPTDFLINKVRLKIYNEPPDWATKYRIVRTRDLSQSSYLIWMIDKVDALDASGNVTLLNQKYYKIYLSNIGYYTEKAERGSVIEYTFEKGDRVRLLLSFRTPIDHITIPINVTFDYLILEAGADYIIIDYDPTNTFIREATIIEIYTKGNDNLVSDPLFYEMSECFEIKTGVFSGVTKKYHTGNDTSFANPNQQYLTTGLVTPACIDLYQGGNYFRYRTMYWQSDTPNPKSRRMWVSSDYADEYEVSKFDGLFRPNTVIEKGRVELPSAIRFSDSFKANTEINGLSAYSGINIEKYSEEYGLLKKLQLIDNDVVKAVFENSFQVSLYVKQGVIRQTQSATALVSVTDDVITNSRVIQRTLGTQNPESVVLNDEGDCFGYDQNKGVVWRSSGNGLVQVSDYLQKTNFNNWSDQRNLYSQKKSQTPSVYDIYHDEYILTLGSIPSQEFVPPRVIIDLLEPKRGGMTIVITIEETGTVVSPLTFISDNVQNELQNHIISSFTAIGFNAFLNPDGTVTVEASSVTFSNYNIIITTGYNTLFLGTNILRNSFFEDPNLPQQGGWESYLNVTQFEYYIAQNIGLPYFLFRAYDQAVDPIDDYCIQYNIGLIKNKTYKLTIDYEGSIENIGIGNFSTPIPNLSSTGPISNAIRTTQTFFLSYFDDPNVYDYLYVYLPKNNLSQNKIYSIQLQELYESFSISRFTFSQGQEAVPSAPFRPLTISFSKAKNGWTHYYSFTPEYYGKINNGIVSFKNGELYVHTPNATPKNYYGVQYARELKFVTNKDFPKVKVYKELMINGLGLNSAPELYIPPYQGVPSGMLSELTTNHFSVKEGMQYAAIQRDKLTPGFSTTDLAWLNGRNMRGQLMLVTLSNGDPSISYIYSAEILYFYSENS